MSRESRLLLLTVAVCAVVLLLLARLRFPDVPPIATAAPPLERLAARASYDALAADIQRVESMIAPNLIVLRVAPPLESTPRRIRDALTRVEPASGVRHVAALRINGDTAIAAIDGGARIDGIVGTSGGDDSAAVLAVDPVRLVARIRVPEQSARPLAEVALASLQTPLYVVVVEGTQAGVTLRPVFLGRGDRFASARWSRPLLPLGGIAITPGALLFSLAGEFIGTVVVENSAPAIAGARDLLDTAEKLAAARQPTVADLGIAVQALTTALVAATGIQRGVVVSEVEADGAAATALEPSDVITAVDDWSTGNPDELLLRLASRPPGDAVKITFGRNGESRRTVVTLGAAKLDVPAHTTIAFVAERGAGTRIGPGSDASISGLQVGDVVTRVAATSAPTPAQLRRVLAQPTASGFAILVIRREGFQRVVAVPVGGRSHATAR